MTDPDLIAYLYPLEPPGTQGPATEVIRADLNRSRFVPPRILVEAPGKRPRRLPGTVTPTKKPLKEHPIHLRLPCLEFRFSKGPQTSYGFVFGSLPNSDVVLDCDVELASN